MKHPCHMLVEYELNELTDAQFIEWACDALSGDDSIATDPTVADLAALRPQIKTDLELASRYFHQMVHRHFPDFTLQSPDAVRWAQEILKCRCDDYLQGSITPKTFCNLVSLIEVRFDYPSWLGDLYHACDWVDEGTKCQDVPNLRDEAKKVSDTLLRP